jgi:sugar phosphate isomerase/epimerase
VYPLGVRPWDQHNQAIVATDEAAWRPICNDIAAAGLEAVEVWEAHAAPESLDEAKARLWKRVLDDSGLVPVAYAGGLRPETLRICQWLGIPHVPPSRAARASAFVPARRAS